MVVAVTAALLSLMLMQFDSTPGARGAGQTSIGKQGARLDGARSLGGLRELGAPLARAEPNCLELPLLLFNCLSSDLLVVLLVVALGALVFLLPKFAAAADATLAPGDT